MQLTLRWSLVPEVEALLKALHLPMGRVISHIPFQLMNILQLLQLLRPDFYKILVPAAFLARFLCPPTSAVTQHLLDPSLLYLTTNSGQATFREIDL